MQISNSLGSFAIILSLTFYGVHSQAPSCNLTGSCQVRNQKYLKLCSSLNSVYIQATAIESQNFSSIDDCWKFCKANENCHWFSFSKILNICLLFDECPEVDENPDFVTSEVECSYNSQSKKRLNYI